MNPSKQGSRIAALAALALIAACADGTAPVPGRLGEMKPLAARSPQAQARLEAIFQRISPEVMALPGTVFSDNDEVAGKVVIGVEHDAAARGVRNAMARLGVNAADYDVELTSPIVFAATLRDAIRPVVAGLQINFTNYVCTLGFNVDHSGGRSFITNSHCTATQGGTEGTLYYQPLKSSNPTAIATEASDPPYAKGNGRECPRGKKCRYSDASRALYASSVTSTRGAIAQTTGFNNGSLTISSTSPTFSITSQDDATTNFAVGTVVNKVGRTTGWTRGQVTRSCTNTSVSGSTVYLICQTFVSDPGGAAVVGGGDSGSAVWRATGGSSVQLVGILWGGSSDNKSFVFSPLKQIQQELGTVNAVQ